MAQTQSATETPALHSYTMEEDSVIHSSNRGLRLPSIATFCIGVVCGVVGGLLLGGTAVIILQSVELLADNRLLMDKLDEYIMINNHWKTVDDRRRKRHMSQRDDPLYNDYVSILANVFCNFTLNLSLAVGICSGLSVYALVIKKMGEAAMGKAQCLAGLVCFMGVTATGCILGLMLEGFLSIDFKDHLKHFMNILVMIPTLAVLTLVCFRHCNYYTLSVLYLWFLSFAVLPGLTMTMFVKSKLCLMILSVVPILALNEYDKIFKLNIASVPLMLIITDVFNIVGQPIVAQQSPSTTNTSSVVLEGIFVGVLASQQFAVVIGMSLFDTWQRGGAGKICAIAASYGTAVLGVLKGVLPMLSPGLTIGALMGVPGAIGVSIAAAGAVTDQYGQVVDHYGWVGRCGVTVGAALGAFLSSFAHSRLSQVFMGLCAASIPAEPYLKQLILFLCRCPWGRWSLCTITTIIILIWLYFTCTMGFVLILVCQNVIMFGVYRLLRYMFC